MSPGPVETTIPVVRLASERLTQQDLVDFNGIKSHKGSYKVGMRHNGYHILAWEKVKLSDVTKCLTKVAAEKAAAVQAAARATAAANLEANAEANMSGTIESPIPCKLFRPKRLETLLKGLFPKGGFKVEVQWDVYIIEALLKVFLGRNPPDSVDGIPILIL